MPKVAKGNSIKKTQNNIAAIELADELIELQLTTLTYTKEEIRTSR